MSEIMTFLEIEGAEKIAKILFLVYQQCRPQARTYNVQKKFFSVIYPFSTGLFKNFF